MESKGTLTAVKDALGPLFTRYVEYGQPRGVYEVVAHKDATIPDEHWPEEEAHLDDVAFSTRRWLLLSAIIVTAVRFALLFAGGKAFQAVSNVMGFTESDSVWEIIPYLLGVFVAMPIAWHWVPDLHFTYVLHITKKSVYLANHEGAKFTPMSARNRRNIAKWMK